jgi:hypothetical protein
MLESIRTIINARKASRWTLYFVHQREGLRYAVHNNAVDILLGYILTPVKSGKIISLDWELHLNFNLENKPLRLVEAFFLKCNVSRILLDLIANIDPDWMVPRGESVFVDAPTRKELPLGASEDTLLSQASRMTAGALCDDKDAHVTLGPC